MARTARRVPTPSRRGWRGAAAAVLLGAIAPALQSSYEALPTDLLWLCVFDVLGV